MHVVTICCKGCKKPFSYTDALWYCCQYQRDKGCFYCIMCKVKRCQYCLRSHTYQTQYITAQRQYNKRAKNIYSPSRGIRRSQNVKQVHYNYSSTEQSKHIQRKYDQRYRHLESSQSRNVPTNIKKVDHYSQPRFQQKKTIPQDIYFDQKCQKDYRINQIHQIINKSTKSTSFIQLICGCHVNKKQLSLWIRQKCLICGKRQNSSYFRTILKNDSYACYNCYQRLQSKVKYGSRASVSQKEVFQYLDSISYKCLSCQKLIKKKQQMGSQSFKSLNSPEELILCSGCSEYSKKSQQIVFNKINLQRQKELQQKIQLQKLNYFDKSCNAYYPIVQIHKLFAKDRKEKQIQLPCKCRVQKKALQIWLQGKCLVCGEIPEQSRNHILKYQGNICRGCDYYKIKQAFSKSQKQLQTYVDSIRYICFQCNQIISQKTSLSEPQQEDQQIVICKYCYVNVKSKEKFYGQSLKIKKQFDQKWKREQDQRTREQNQRIKKQNQRIKRKQDLQNQFMKHQDLNYIQSQKRFTDKEMCPICCLLKHLIYVQDLGIKICHKCRRNNESQNQYQIQKKLNKQRFNQININPINSKLKYECSKCSRLILKLQWIAFKQLDKIICNQCYVGNQKQGFFEKQPQIKQKYLQQKEVDREPNRNQEKLLYKKPARKLQREPDREQQYFRKPERQPDRKPLNYRRLQKQPDTESQMKKKDSSKLQQSQNNYPELIRKQFSSIKQSKIQNIQKKVIIQNSSGYHQTHSKHIKEQQINQKGEKIIKEEKHNTQVRKSHRNQKSQQLSEQNFEKFINDCMRQKISKQNEQSDQNRQKSEVFQQEDKDEKNIQDSLQNHRNFLGNNKILPDQMSFIEMNKISGIKDSEERRFLQLKSQSIQSNESIEMVLQKLNDQSLDVQIVPINMKKQESQKQQSLVDQSLKSSEISFKEVQKDDVRNNKQSNQDVGYEDSLDYTLRSKLKQVIQDKRQIDKNMPQSDNLKQNSLIKSQSEKEKSAKNIDSNNYKSENEKELPDNDPLVEEQFAIIQNQQTSIDFQQEKAFQTCMQCGYMSKINQMFLITNDQKILVGDRQNQRQKNQGIKMCKSCYVFQKKIYKQSQIQNSRKRGPSSSKLRQMKSVQKTDPLSIKRYISAQKKKVQYTQKLHESQALPSRKTGYLNSQMENINRSGMDLIKEKLKIGNSKVEEGKINYPKYNLTGSVQNSSQKKKQVSCSVCLKPVDVLCFDKYCTDCFRKI